MKGYMYILECSDTTYYVGSTKNLKLRLSQHQTGEGAIYTKTRLPVKLVYFEEFNRIDTAFYREKQVQGWSRKKREALIYGDFEKLPELSKNHTGISAGSITGEEVTQGEVTGEETTREGKSGEEISGD